MFNTPIDDVAAIGIIHDYATGNVGVTGRQISDQAVLRSVCQLLAAFCDNRSLAIINKAASLPGVSQG